MRRPLLTVVFAVLSMHGITWAQWDIKWHSPQGKEITGCEVIQSGRFDNSRTRSFVACFSEKTGDELAIIDGLTGDVRWRSEQYFKIFKESVHVTDVDGDGKDEIVFAAQNTPKSTVALYKIAASGKSFAESPRPDADTRQPSSPQRKEDPVQPARSPSGGPHSVDPPPAPASSTASASNPPVASDPPRTLQPDAAADIAYRLSAADSVQIIIYDGTGAPVRTLLQTSSPAGSFVKTWDGTDDKGVRLPVGPYFYTVTVGTTTAARKKVTFR